MTTWQVQFLSSSADNFIRQVMIGKPNHVQKVPQWYGETIGFWDGTTLDQLDGEGAALDPDALHVRDQRQDGDG